MARLVLYFAIRGGSLSFILPLCHMVHIIDMLLEQPQETA